MTRRSCSTRRRWSEPQITSCRSGKDWNRCCRISSIPRFRSPSHPTANDAKVAYIDNYAGWIQKKFDFSLLLSEIIVIFQRFHEDWQSDRMRWTRNPVYPFPGIGGLNPSSSANTQRDKCHTLAFISFFCGTTLYPPSTYGNGTCTH